MTGVQTCALPIYHPHASGGIIAIGMNSTKTVEPEPTSALSECRDFVGVHVGVGGLSAAVVGCPAGNEIGSLLLWRVLESALARDGIETCGPGGRLGPLNDCVILIPARDPEQAIQTIKTELHRVALLAVCQIGINDDGDWRCVYPSSEVKMDWLLDPERQELYSNQFREGADNFLRKAAGEAGDKE